MNKIIENDDWWMRFLKRNVKPENQFLVAYIVALTTLFLLGVAVGGGIVYKFVK